MYLVDNVHPFFYLGGGVNGIVPQIPDVIHTIVGCRIDFQDIHTGAVINGLTGAAAIAGIAIVRVEAVYRLGQNLGAGGFACTPGAGKQIGMAHLAGHQLVFQSLRDRHLTGNIVKCLRTIFTI